MKNTVYHLCVVTLLLFLAGCSELADMDFYKDTVSEVNNDELIITDLTSLEYLSSCEELSRMTAFLDESGIFKELQAKGQLHTLLMVENDDFVQPVSDSAVFVARSHVSDVALSPGNLFDGETVMMWHGKYTKIMIDSIGQRGRIIGHVKVNSSSVRQIVKTRDGYIYVISDMIKTPTSLYDYINALGEEYSIFKELVLECGTREFNKEESKALYINEDGNTVYDSVFTYESNFFESVGFNLDSESITATMLLYSNDVIRQAIEEARTTLALWGRTRDESRMMTWILKSAFFDVKYQPHEMMTSDLADLYSIFDIQWRTNIQKVDTVNCTELSNGRVYEVTDLHLPHNLLLYRIKEYFYYYEYCSQEEKTLYFKTDNLEFRQIKDDVAEWSPVPGILPYHKNRVLYYNIKGEDFALDAACLETYKNDIGMTCVRPVLVPPGAYRLAMGFKRALNIDLVVEVMIGDLVIAVSDPFNIDTSYLYQYDRSGKLDNTMPEDYEEIIALYGSSSSGIYDADGGPVIDEVVIPDINGDGSPVNIHLNIRCSAGNGLETMPFHHWCLRPTANDY